MVFNFLTWFKNGRGDLPLSSFLTKLCPLWSTMQSTQISFMQVLQKCFINSFGWNVQKLDFF